MSNPFRDGPVADAETPATEPATSVFETPPEAVEVEIEAEADESYGKFPDPEAKPAKGQASPGVQKRISKLVGERNELRETLAEKEARLAAAEARADTLAELNRVVAAHYAENPGLLDFDARFMAAFDQMAQTDVTIAAVAQRIKAAMSGEEAPVTTPETPEVAEEAAPSTDPALTKIITRDVQRTFNEVLTEHGVKPHFVKAIASDVLATLEADELADLSPEDVVEIAKVYVQQNDIPMAEFLAPKKGAKAPATTSGRSTPARNNAPEAPDAADERAKPKTIEEWEAQKNKRFKALTRELGFNS